jgi:hypothetical protein
VALLHHSDLRNMDTFISRVINSPQSTGQRAVQGQR